MTREEEIMKAARVYADGIAQHLPNKKYCEEDFIAGVKWADSHPHWKSIDELPKIGKDVLVLREDGEMQVAHQYNESIARWWSVDGFPLKNSITHWMSLPKMPILFKSGNTGKDLKGGNQ